ncbi:hypothetical protein E5206_06490 [Arthrobacter sp. PAMC25564]|uniref:hypothetical protein n=1 Tax=Arthrobacter sp. PAMC25564 TaxID=2565366 RepID=UPI0010A262A3|nr:hypothetical protein [Arthrobacter sp. PAMC25564]QCB96622.1 hypothetical protein E5206_06490 [Arthrobacter sp. PAMC25564]
MELDGKAPKPGSPDGAPSGGEPFAGVPFLVKDLALEIDGTPFSEGSRWLAGNVSRHDRPGYLPQCRGL